MMSLLTDPVVLICCGVVVVGTIVLFWAIGKYRRMGSAVLDLGPTDDLLPKAPALPDLDFPPPTIPTRAPASAPPVVPVATSPGVSKDVADRLENMTQRLSEMQTVLMKQSTASQAAGGAPAAGGVGQGFSPETIEKLLKIIGNVIQQVDILQKNLNISK
jgi:hypothetical protein